MSFSIVIPSKNLSNLTACVGRLREMGETARVINVWDFGEKRTFKSLVRPISATFDLNIEAYEGEYPFVFARNVNIGLRAHRWEDVIVMNDDALLETPRGLTMLAECAAANLDYGIIAASVDSCGTLGQIHNKAKSGLREEKPMLAFICVYIPRTTIDRIGLLDERFGVNAGGAGARGYGLEDDDYCWRIRKAGLKLGVLNDVFVNHTTLPSTFRNDPEHKADVLIHEELFWQKWGIHPRDPRGKA